MDTNEKAALMVDAEGSVLRCAKGLNTDQCGYKMGAKVCGACGAMPVEAKGVMASDGDGADGEDACDCDNPMPGKDGICKKCGMPVVGAKMLLEERSFTPRVLKKKGKNGPDSDYGVGMERENDEDVLDQDNFKPKGKAYIDDMPAFLIDSDIAGKEYGTGKERQMGPNDDGFAMDLKKKRKKRRLDTMGMKSADGFEDLFICALGREVKSASDAGPCADCRGGCIAPDGGVDLLEIEGLAEDMLLGKVHNSGYSDEQDMFVIQLERKDGQYVEAYFTGEGELDGWFRIPEEEVLGKSAYVSIDEAVSSALGVIEGKALGYGVGEFEGFEAYSIEVEGLDGKSYDVFVAPGSGEVLGYDQYDWSYDDTIEGKRAYSQDQRDSMAKQGHALPDGSYPIADENDLENAVMASGRAKNKDKVKAHIMKRAHDLGRADMIPEEWKSDLKSALSDVEAALLEMDMIAIEQDLV